MPQSRVNSPDHTTCYASGCRLLTSSRLAEIRVSEPAGAGAADACGLLVQRTRRLAASRLGVGNPGHSSMSLYGNTYSPTDTCISNHWLAQRMARLLLHDTYQACHDESITGCCYCKQVKTCTGGKKIQGCCCAKIASCMLSCECVFPSSARACVSFFAILLM